MVLNPATFLPDPEEPPLEHSCIVVLEQTIAVHADLFHIPLSLPDHSWFTDSSSYILNGQERAGYTIVTTTHTVESSPFAPNTSAQKAELSTLIGALQLGKGLKISIYTDPKSAYYSLHSCAATWREQGFLTTRGSSIKHASLILELGNRQLLFIVRHITALNPLRPALKQQSRDEG